MADPSFLIAFGVGFLSFLSPCTLPILPGYFSYLAGVGREEAGNRRRLKVLVTSLAFVAGFSLVLITLGTAASAAGQFLLRNKRIWQKIGGLIIVIFGLQTAGVLKLTFLKKGKNFNFEKLIPWPRGKSFLAGASFGMGWTPCIGPILGSILILASQTLTLSRGIGLLVFYALGLAIPMVLSGVFLSQVKFLRQEYILRISGGVLLVLGTLLFFGQYSKLTFWTSVVYRSLNLPIY